MTIWILHQFFRRAELDFLAVGEGQDPIAFNDCLESVGDRDHRAIAETFVYESLNRFFSHNVNISSGLVQNHYLVLAQNSPTDANER